MEAPRSRSQGPPRPPGRRGRYHSDSDSSSSDENGEKKAKPKPAPKQILYTGLACVATLAAANNIYQSAKAHHTRQRELEEGEITSAEAQKLKMQARKMDLISLGVAAVGAYNVKNGWKRAEGHVSSLSESYLHLSYPFSSLKTCLSSDQKMCPGSSNMSPNSRIRLRREILTLKRCSGRHIRNRRLREGDSADARAQRILNTTLLG